MPNTTFTFNRNNFTSATPDWSTEGEYSKSLRFNTVTKTIRLDNTNYSRGTFTITFPGGYDYGSVHFSTPNGSIVSSSPSINGLYSPNNMATAGPVEEVFKGENITTTSPVTYYVVVNGDPDKKAKHLNVSIALAKKNSIPSSNIEITLDYECPSDSGNELYEYEVGVHPYSSYDAEINRAAVKTKLYSATPITGWTTNTPVYMGSYFQNAALPYWYGYGSKVYRVGDPWKRSYGIKHGYDVRITTHWFFKRRKKIKEITIGPLETLLPGNDNNEPTSESCIKPTLRNVGKIRRIINSSGIPQPQQYKYYMGYDASNKYTANSGPFVTWDIPNKKSYPTTGLIHAFQKLTFGIFSGFDKTFSVDFNWVMGVGPLGMAAVSYLFNDKVFNFFLNGFCIGCGTNGPLPALKFAGFSKKTVILLGKIFFWAAVAFLLIALYLAFKPRTIPFREKCRLFLHHFANTPYLSTGTTLYRDDDLEHDNAGWYSDGVYYYEQTGTAGSRTITKKQLSGINSYLGRDEDNNSGFGFKYSLPADQYDISPDIVTDWRKLVLLPYCAGEPLPYCGGSTIFYSAERTHTVTTHCCDLEDCNTPIVISLPYGAVTSCVSQVDADSEAQEQFQAAIDYADEYGVYTKTIDDSYIGQLEVNFTHEIKEEDNPTALAFFWDLRSGSDAPVGTPLYYDPSGCQKLLPGYYATSGSDYPKYYYEVANGEVAAIYTQSAASSTTTTTGQSIIKTNEDKSSNWYLKSTLQNPIVNYIATLNNRTFNVNSLFTTSPYELSAGRIISGSYTDDAFEKYDTFNSNGITSTTTTEQGTGWYVPLNGWSPEPGDEFFYQNTLTSFTGGTRYTTSGSAICAGSNTGNTYYHDGESASPGLGDKIYDTNDIDDPTADGFIKYTSDLYMEIEEGVMVDSLSCTPSTDFSGSSINSGSRVSYAKARSTNERLYTHNGSSSTLAVGDTISFYGSSAVGAGFIRYQRGSDIYIAHTDSNGVVLQLFDEDTAGAWTFFTATLTVGGDGIGGTSLKGYNTTESPTTGGGGYSNDMGDLQYKFNTSQEGNLGWKTTGVFEAVTSNGGGFYTVNTYLVMKYPADVNKPTTYWESLRITNSSSTTTVFNVADAESITNFVEGGERFYVWNWREITSSTSSPFGSTGTTAKVYLYEETV